MYQGQGYNLAAVMPAAIATGLFSSLATFQAPEGWPGDPVVTGAGQPSGVYVDVPGYVNIPCQSAPTSNLRISADETKRIGEIESFNSGHVLLSGFYPGIASNSQWRVSITDPLGNVTIYDVDGAESDSQAKQTRVKIQVSTV